MSQSSEAPSRPANRSRPKGGSKRQDLQARAHTTTEPQAQDDWLAYGDDYTSFGTTNQTYGTREIINNVSGPGYPPSPPIYPHSPPPPEAHPGSPSSPTPSSLWSTAERAPVPIRFKNVSRGQSPSSAVSSPQPHHLRPNVSQPSTSSPPGQFATRESPPSEHYMQPRRFAHRPPAHIRAAENPVAGASKPYFRSFDTLEVSGHPASTASHNVVLSGYAGHLDVSNVDSRRTKLIARLDVPQDIVLGAKIVPCRNRQDEFRGLRPLVVLILYGQPSQSICQNNYDANQQTAVVEDPRRRADIPDSDPCYETRVEVRSLRDGSCVATLYKSPPISASLAALPHHISLQQPSTDLVIEAQDNFIAVASAASGEVFVFAPSANLSAPNENFCCIGKFWTSIRKRLLSSGLDNRPGSAQDDSQQPRGPAPILSLSHRWLAIVPPSTASRHSVQGTVPVSPDDARPPGVESVTAPPPPTSNCNVDIPDPESFTNKMAKGVAKEVVRGAQWVGAQGWQAWQNYWNKPSHSNADPGARADPILDPQFPPTHAEHQRASSEDLNSAYQVSLIDLQHLLHRGSSKSRRKYDPLATFTLPAGCSFVSFAPSGLFLLTVSRNGDTQYVWDLLQLGARRPLPKFTTNTGQSEQSVREVARFSRFTNASVVDVAWSAPKSDKLAMITDNGTVHVFKLPTSAFVWPPPRRRASLEGVPEDMPVANSSTQSSNANMQDTRLPLGQPNPLSSVASRVSDKTKPLVATVRRHSTSGVSMLTNNLGELNLSTSASIQKGKALAAGVSRSIGAAAGQISQIRRTSESRFHLKTAPGAVQPGSIRFLTGNERGFVGAISGDTLLFHWLSGSEPATTSSGPLKESELALTNVPASPYNADAQPRSFFAPLADDSPGPQNDSAGDDLSSSIHPLAYAEIETNAPFRPFYTDRRIALSTYKDPQTWHHDVSHDTGDVRPWAFGADIPIDAVDLGAERSLAAEAYEAPSGRAEETLSVGLEKEPRLAVQTQAQVQDDGHGRGPEEGELWVSDDDGDDDELFGQVAEADKTVH